MRSLPDDPRLGQVRAVAETTAGLELLLLVGSRATGEAHERSDWDLAFIGSRTLDVAMLHGELTIALRTDDVDLVDLDRAGALMRFNAADTGALLFEHESGVHERFWLDAVHFWCENRAIIEREYDAILAALP